MCGIEDENEDEEDQGARSMSQLSFGLLIRNPKGVKRVEFAVSRVDFPHNGDSCAG